MRRQHENGLEVLLKYRAGDFTNGKMSNLYVRVRMLLRRYKAAISRRVRVTRLGSISHRLYQLLEYELWIWRCERAQWSWKRAKQEIDGFSYTPIFSILLPAFNSDPKWLEKAIASVQNQAYPHWELCVCDDGSTDPRCGEMLRKYAQKDGRIKVVFSPQNEGISAASNRALALAAGEFIGLLDHDDELSPYALYEVAKLLQSHPMADMIYSDEDKLLPSGKRGIPFFKPDWSPEYFLSCMYTCHLGVYRKKLVDEIGGFRLGFEGSQDYDLVLRITEKTNEIYHIAKVLYHWRINPGSAAGSSEAKPFAYTAGRRALMESVERRRLAGDVKNGCVPGHYRVRFQIQAAGLVSIIIPTKDKVELLKQCIQSIQERSTYQNLEIIVVDNQSQQSQTLDYLSTISHRILKFNDPFNFSSIINLGASQAAGKYLVLLNNDTEVISPDWIESMMEFCQYKEIGVVGAKLLFPDKKIQHIGVVLGLGGVAGHPLTGFPDDTHQQFCTAGDIRNYSAVTAACMMMRKEVFDEVAGFDEQLAVAFNDVDFCLRVRQVGYRIVFTPYAELYHLESASRGYDLDRAEKKFMQNRWGEVLRRDPYYNPNLTRSRGDFGVRLD